MSSKRPKKSRYYYARKRNERIKKEKQLKLQQQQAIDFWSRCVTESIFYLTPYILFFIVLGIIFK